MIAEKKFGVRIIGSITMPLAVVCVILMQLLPSEVRPLVPALQSTWLHVHVTLAMLAYATCAVSFALAMMFLIQDDFRNESFLAWTSATVSAIYVAIVVTRFDRGGLRVTAWDATTKSDMFLGRGMRLFVTVPDLGMAVPDRSGWLQLLPCSLFRRPLEKRCLLFGIANRAIFISILLQFVVLAAFALRVRNASYPSPDQDGLFPTSLAASPFLLGGMVTGIFASLLYLMLLVETQRPGRAMCHRMTTLDRITYKTICIAFPLLTFMIATGAYWANRTWGSYWSWDPKETWAAITWLVYAGYLHMRITRGWRGRRAAYFAILGFGVVIFTFLGVTYLLPGLHAYA